jgi:hypothetical protein
MTALSKIGKRYLELAQFSFGRLGGLFYCLICLLSLFIKPLRKLVATYKEGAPIYSTLFMTLIIASIMAVVGFFIIINQEDATIESVGILFIFLFLFISPWIFLSLDLFAYYKRFRSDRVK